MPGRRMRVLIVSGIWPPDVGGPASHAPELASFLRARGHAVEVVTTAAARPAPEAYAVRWISRRVPVGARHLAVALLIARRARAADVVYATSMVGRSSLGSALARRPLVVKLTGDDAYERARRWGLFSGDLDAFQDHRGPAVAIMRGGRDRALRRARHVFVPSSYLREIAVGWGLASERVSVLPNPIPELPEVRPREELRAELGFDGPTLGFAGRLTTAKALDIAFAALARVEGVALAIAGDGPDRADLEREATDLGLDGRVTFLGAQPRERVLELFRGADAVLLSSTWENFPHAVVEALAVGAPMVATSVGGVPELVEDGVNGLLVPSGDVAALEQAIRRIAEEPGLRDRLAAAAQPSVDRLRPARVYGRLEETLKEAAS